MKVLDQKYFTFVNIRTNASKHYYLSLLYDAGIDQYKVMAAWGRIGNRPQEKIVMTTHSASFARTKFESVVRTRLSRDYKVADWGEICPLSPPWWEQTFAQKATEAQRELTGQNPLKSKKKKSIVLQRKNAEWDF